MGIPVNRPTFNFDSRHNPEAPDSFTIFHRNYVCLLRLIFLSRSRGDKSARSTKREAEENDRDLRHPAHRVVLTYRLSFSRKPAPDGGGK